MSLMTTWGDGEIARLRTVTPSCVPHALGKREMLVDGALGVVLVEDVFGCRSGSLALHSYGHTRGTNDAAYGKLLSPANAHVGRSPPFTDTRCRYRRRAGPHTGLLARHAADQHDEQDDHQV